MRFVLAIASLVLAAVLIVLGIAQRTVFLGPDKVELETKVSSSEPYTVIGGSVLTSHEGTQSVSVTGDDGEKVFVAYGRTSNVEAWLGQSKYNQLALNKDGTQLVDRVKTPEVSSTIPASTAPEGVSPATWDNPAGSDMWLWETSEDTAVIAPISVPEDVSVIIASDGTKPAPKNITVSWPLDNSTPWAGPLIVAGLAFLLLGIILYLLGVRHMRKSRGPRRKSLAPLPEEGSKVKLPRARKYRPEGGATGPRFGKRSLVVVPLGLATVLALSGCSAAYWPGGATQSPEGNAASVAPLNPTDPSASPSATSDADALPNPVVTEPQAKRIIQRISVTTHEADQAKNLDLAKTRFAGPALTEREIGYKIQGVNAQLAPLTPVPGSPLRLTLPQATDGWPRTLLTVVADKDDPTLAPTALMLVQDSPRANYVVHYATRLEPKVTIPDVASVTVGAASVPADSAFLAMAPDQLAAAYGDILTNGEQSESYGKFAADGDSLRTQIKKFRDDVTASLADKAATAEFRTEPGTGKPLALATNDSGAIVSVSLHDIVKVSPTSADAKVKPSGEAVAALLGAAETTKPLQTTYEEQLLFYVPAKDSNQKITLLGFSQALIKAEEVQ
ncbi:hypothetical protein D9V34_11600 [Mycetocola lacteus]|uniref:DUF8094 domain-containing protein n=1 Tax=Mycetocola lacteus TaxID=76637 RepID=A0A3L7AQL3_9MICO|nr:hypothetical protein [Mycetocola lacteus]RLP82414.1 hypothetical protein D9V34_11600 [Mycetocola lacteus]